MKKIYKIFPLIVSFFIILSYVYAKHELSSTPVVFNQVDIDQLKQRAFVSGYGYKTAYLIELDNFLKKIQTNKGIRITVPEFIGISDQEVKNFLLRLGFDFGKAWIHLIQEAMPVSEQQKAFIKKNLPLRFRKKLRKLSNTLKDLCSDASRIEISESVKAFVNTSNYSAWRLMVRSSGKEDFDQQISIESNHTEINITPLSKQVMKAVGKVLASYVSEKLFLYRLQKGDKTVFEEPLMPVLIQRMVGEPLMKGSCDAPVCVNSPILSSGCIVRIGESNDICPGVAIIQSSYGHNQGIVNSLVPIDTYYQGPSGIMHQIIRLKEKRLVPVEKRGASGLVLQSNPDSHVKASTLSKTYVQIINHLVKLLQFFYGYRISLELVCCPQEKTIYIVEVRSWLKKTQKQNEFCSGISIPAQAKISSLPQVHDLYSDFSIQMLFEKIKVATAVDWPLLYKSLLAKIKQHMRVIHKAMSSSQEACSLHQRNCAQALKKLHDSIRYLFAMAPEVKKAMEHPACSQERLYALRFIEAVLFQIDDPEIVRSYSIDSILDCYQKNKQFITNEILPLMQQQKIGVSFLYNELFFEYAKLGVRHAKNREVKEAWLMFLDSFYTATTKHDLDRFNLMIKSLKSFDVFAAWLNSSFITVYNEVQDEELFARDVFLCLYQEYTSAFKDMQLFDEYKRRMRSHVAAEWQDHRLFEYHYKRLESGCFAYFLSYKFADLIHSCYHGDNFLRKITLFLLLQTITESVERIIKAVKKNIHDTNQYQKIRQIKKLLHFFLSFIEQLGLNQYFEALCNQALNTSHQDFRKELKNSSDFSLASIFSIQESLVEKKHNPRSMELKTLLNPFLTIEDVCVALHYLFLYQRNKLIDDWNLSHVFKKTVIPTQRPKKHEGMIYQKNNRLYFYHNTLGASCLSVSFQYEKKYKATSLKLQFHGSNDYARWTIVKDYLVLVAHLAGFSIKQIQLTDTGNLACLFEFTVKTNFSLLVDHLEGMIGIIFDEAYQHDFPIVQKAKNLLNRLFKRLQQSNNEQGIFDFLIGQGKTKKKFNLFLFLLAEKLILLDKSLVVLLLQKGLQKTEEFWLQENAESKPLVFLLLEMMCSCMKKLSNDQEIVRLAETDFETLAQSTLELNDDDSEDEVIELIIQEVKDGLKKIIFAKQ